MKRKHFGIISILTIFSTLTAAGGYAFYALDDADDVGRIRQVKTIPDIAVPSAAALHDLNRLEHKMHRLAQPVLSDPRPVNLGPLGYDASYKRKNSSSGETSKKRTPFGYSLTFAFQSDRRRLCIIDGEMYQEGADLPDSGKLLKIEPKRVLIKKNGVQNWVSLDENALHVRADTN